MKKLLLSSYLMFVTLAPAYCSEGDIESLIYIFKSLLFIFCLFVLLFLFVFGLLLLIEWFAGDPYEHPERRLVVNVMYTILAILSLGTIVKKLRR